MKDKEHKGEGFTPIIYYHDGGETKGTSIETKCLSIAIIAMGKLYPDKEVVSASFVDADSMKSGMLSSISWCIEKYCTDDKKYLATIQKKEKYLRKLFKDLNFDEYYMVSIGTKDEENERSTIHNLLAIDKSLKKVVITIDYDERMEFLCSLGPKHEHAIHYGLSLYNEITDRHNRS